MPIKKPPGRVAASNHHWNSDSSDEEDCITPERYVSAGLPAAFHRRQDRVRAMQELAACLDVYRDCGNKQLQGLLLEDVLHAIRVSSLDRSTACRAALEQVIKVAERVLPQQKRSQVVAEFKKHSLASYRAHRKQGAVVDQEDPDYEFDCLPFEVVHHIFKALDHVSLALASCTCTAWRSAASDDALWASHLQACFPRSRAALAATQQHGRASSMPGSRAGAASSSKAGQQRGSRAAFAMIAQQHADHVKAWCSNRRLSKGRLLWLDSGKMLPQDSGAPPTGSRPQAKQLLSDAARAAAAEPVPLTVEQVVMFLRSGCARHCGLSAEAASSSSGSESDSSCDDCRASTSQTARKFKLWAIK